MEYFRGCCAVPRFSRRGRSANPALCQGGVLIACRYVDQRASGDTRSCWRSSTKPGGWPDDASANSRRRGCADWQKTEAATCDLSKLVLMLTHWGCGVVVLDEYVSDRQAPRGTT